MKVEMCTCTFAREQTFLHGFRWNRVTGHGSELQMDFLQASWWGPDRGNDKFIREK